MNTNATGPAGLPAGDDTRDLALAVWTGLGALAIELVQAGALSSRAAGNAFSQAAAAFDGNPAVTRLLDGLASHVSQRRGPT